MRYIKPMVSLLLMLGPGQLIAVFAVTVLTSALEILGVGLIFGFAKLVFDPTSVENFPGGNWIGEQIAEDGAGPIFVLIGAAIVALFLVKGVVGFGAVALRVRYSGRLTSAFARELMALYARQPYEKLLQMHSADFIKNLLHESAVLGAAVLTPLVGIAAEATFVVMIVGFLLLIDPAATMGAVLFFAVGYGSMFVLINPMTARAGKQRVVFLSERTRAAVEFVNGIREIIVSGRSRYFLQKFSNADLGFVGQENRLRAFPMAPALGVQFLAVSSAVIFILYYHSVGKSSGDIIATVALFGAAGLRMMPALNSIVRDGLHLRGHWSSFVKLEAEYRNLLVDQLNFADFKEPLPIEGMVALRNVTYRYPGAKNDALCGVTIEIPCGSSVGIVGPNGAGKSTAVEILLGLLSPQSGDVEVDGKRLERQDIGRWQRSLGYVPQHIYLADDTIARNIAFGMADEEIDLSRVEEVAELACIDSFIREGLAAGYDSKVGERGVGLSGGEIQRIGLARALYTNPQLLILDEATSALDTVQETLINQAVRSLTGKVTTVVIAHRLSSIRCCDQIFVMDKGKIVGHGSYDALMGSCELFANLAIHAGQNVA